MTKFCLWQNFIQNERMPSATRHAKLETFSRQKFLIYLNGGIYMDFQERMRRVFEKSVEVSKDLFSKASETAKDLSEKGVLHLEIRELEGRAKKELFKLGQLVHECFVHEGKASITAKNHDIASILEKISHIETEIDKREAMLAADKK